MRSAVAIRLHQTDNTGTRLPYPKWLFEIAQELYQYSVRAHDPSTFASGQSLPKRDVSVTSVYPLNLGHCPAAPRTTRSVKVTPSYFDACPYLASRHFHALVERRLRSPGGTAPGGQGMSSRLQYWSVRPCVRPLSAAHVTAGHNALRGSGPGQKLAFDNALAMWVVLIAGSTGSALRAVRPPNLHITPDVRCDLVQAASAAGSL